MRLLFLTDNFPPEVNAPASRTFEHCREWVRRGHDVTVVTCAPNFPTGKLLGGYRNRPLQRETMDGIRVVRVWSYITANEGFLRRVLDYASFMASATLVSPLAGRADVVVATSPQFFTACAGWMVSVLKRRPFVFEVRDLWPDSIKAVGALKDGPALRALERLELFLYRRADLIVTVTSAFREEIARRGIDRSKIEVVTNGADLSRFRPMPKDAALVAKLGLEGKLVAGYVGTHGMAHGLDTLLRAAALLRDEPGGRDVRFLFLGDGANKGALKAEAERLGLANVIFLDTVPKEEVPRYWSLLDLSVIHLKRTDLFKTVIPSKLFECMAMGIPVLHGVEGESAEIVAREGVGLAFEPENEGDLVRRLLALAHDGEARSRMAARGPEAARRYDRQALAGEMLSALEALAARS